MADTDDRSSSLAAALVRALGEFVTVPESKRVDAGSRRYTYATLADVLAMARPVLRRHGLGLVQDVTVDDDRVRVVTILVHDSGELMRFGPICLDAAGGPQAVGSATTYGRRYGALSALGIATDDDDDARVVADRGSATVSSHPQPPPPTPSKVSTPPTSRPRSGASALPSGSAQARQAKAAAAAITKAEEWRARVKELPSGEVRARASKVFTDAGAQPGVALSGEQAVVILGGLKKYEPRIVLIETSFGRDDDVDEPLFDDGPPLDDENVPADD